MRESGGHKALISEHKHVAVVMHVGRVGVEHLLIQATDRRGHPW